jgi:hypothetical protein
VTATLFGPPAGDALIVGDYRYWLSRTWDADGPVLCWVMLNPSTADADTDDPTITRCRKRAMRLEYRGKPYGSIVVVNLFAWRATKPDELLEYRNGARHRAVRPDAVGPDNNAWLFAHATGAQTVVAAWGAHRWAEPRAAEVRLLLLGVTGLWCLGTAASGAPVHPLYIPYDTPLSPLPPNPACRALW